MLRHLTIQNFVLIEQCSLGFGTGLNVMTGETGAGKSILLDALGLALGERVTGQPLRDAEKPAVIAAEFDRIPAVDALLAENGILIEDETLLIRRVLLPGGKGKCLLNEQPAGVSLLKEIAPYLLEIHGQHGQAALHDLAMQRAMLDQFAGLTAPLIGLAAAYEAWKAAVTAQESLAESIRAAQREEEYLRHVEQELKALRPVEGEEEELAESRAGLMKAEKLGGLLAEALAELQGARPVAGAIQTAERVLLKSELASSPILQPAIEALERVQIELAEAEQSLESLADSHGYDPQKLEQVEERLFALRGAARKHQVTVGELPALLQRIQASLAGLESQEAALAECAKQVAITRAAFLAQAEAVSATRKQAASALATQVMAELGPLKMAATRFHVVQEVLEESQWHAAGIDRIRFEVSTNPGSPFGPLHKIASGGELSRFMLALKVVLAQGKQDTTLIFDEIDTGTSGAVADAIGERLARLGAQQQVMVITHLPQVASKSSTHFKVAKTQGSDATQTMVTPLDHAARKEELAQMLSGKEITAEARQAAERLMEKVN